MFPTEYTQSRDHRLSNRKISELSEPLTVKALWIRSTPPENIALCTTYLHKHSCFEAHYVFEGEIEYETEDSHIHKLYAGDALVIPPEEMHRIVYTSEDTFRISIAFLLNARSPASFKFSFGEEIVSAFNTMFREAENKDELSNLLIRNSVLSTLTPYIRQAGITVTNDDLCGELEESNGGDIRVARVKRYINDNKGVFLDCEDVAKYSHFNVKYLNRIFRQETGQTLLEYIHSVKIEEAERLLGDPSLSIDTVSERLGFTNVQYFSTFFKRRTGHSPALYRRLRFKS